MDNPWSKVSDSIGQVLEVNKSITDKAIYAELENGLVGMIHYKEISYKENIEDIKKYKKNQIVKVKLIEIKNEKIKLSIRALEKDPMNWFKENNKKVNDIITTKVYEVSKTGVKVAIDKEKQLISLIKKSDLAKESSDARPEIFSPGNSLDAKITELDLETRKIKLCKSCSN